MSGGTRWTTAFCVLLIAVGAGLAWRVSSRPDASAVPEVELSAVSRPVAELIRAAREDVLRAPRSADRWGYLGMALRAHEFEMEAMACFREAERLDPGEFRWPYLLGVSLAIRDQEAARQAFERAVLSPEALPVGRLRLAELLLDLGRLEEAGEQIEAALALAPGHPRAHLARSRLELRRGHVTEALIWGERAARGAPRQRAIHELLATIHHRLGNRAAVEAHLRQAERLPSGPAEWDDPIVAEVLELRRDPGWTLVQAQGLLAQRRWAEAVALLEDVVDAAPDMIRGHVLLGRTHTQAGDLGRAALVLDRAGRRHPEAPEIAYQRGVVHFLAGEFAEAAAKFEEAVERKPDYGSAHYNLGQTLLRLEEPCRAVASFRAAIGLQPDLAAAHVGLARGLIKTGSDSEAQESLRTALRLEPGNAEARRLLQSTGD